MVAGRTAGTTATRRHPFSAAIEARDHRGLVETLAPDVVLRSAVVHTTFDGRDTVGELYASVIDAFDTVEVVDEFWNEDTYLFCWRGRIDGRDVEGADRLRLDGSGKVREITVFGRPLAGLAAFLTGIGARFARRRRGEAAASTLKAAGQLLAPVFTALEPVTRWLIRAPRRRDRVAPS